MSRHWKRMDAETEQPPDAAPSPEAQRCVHLRLVLSSGSRTHTAHRGSVETQHNAVEQPQQPQQQQQPLRPLSGRHGGGVPHSSGWAAPPPWGLVPPPQGPPLYGMPYPYAQAPPSPVGGGGVGPYGQQPQGLVFGGPPQGYRPPPPGPMSHGVCDWLVHMDEEGDLYYENTRSGFTTWVRPAVGLWGDPATRPVPVRSVPVHGCTAPWVEVTCDDGKVFWHDEKVSTWTMPAAVQHARAQQQQQQQQQQRAAAAAAAQMVPPPMPPRMPPPMPPLMPPPMAVADEEEFDPTFDEEDIAPAAPQPTPAQQAEAAAAAAAAEAAAADAMREAQEKAAATADAFRQMLKEVGVTTHTTWAAVLPRLSVDARFRAVASLSQRRLLFDAHVKELKQPAATAKAVPSAAAGASAALAAKEAAARKRKAADANLLDRERRKAEELRRREAFRTLLSEAVRDAGASYADWQATLARDPQGRGAPTADDGPLPVAHMAQLFDEHVKGLGLHYAQQFRQLLAERLTAAVALNGGPGNPCSSFEAAETMLGQEHRWQRCLPSDRRALWTSHCASVMPAATVPVQAEGETRPAALVNAVNADDMLRDLDDA